MEDIRGVRLRKFNLRKIILGVRMHFRHKRRAPNKFGTPNISEITRARKLKLKTILDMVKCSVLVQKNSAKGWPGRRRDP